MTVRLRDEDRRAVDLLLDDAASGSSAVPAGADNGNGQLPSAFSPVTGEVQARLPGVQNVLQMLDMLPADEPPHDLLARTLRRVDSELGNHPSALRPPQPATGTQIHQRHA